VWKFVTPQLPVRDPEASQRWYRDVLGLKPGFVRPGFAAVRDEAVELFFSRADGPAQPTLCAVRVDDADGLYAIYRERGVEIAEPIADRVWGVREFTLRDPDGHRFRLGHSTRQR